VFHLENFYQLFYIIPDEFNSMKGSNKYLYFRNNNTIVVVLKYYTTGQNYKLI